MSKTSVKQPDQPADGQRVHWTAFRSYLDAYRLLPHGSRAGFLRDLAKQHDRAQNTMYRIFRALDYLEKHRIRVPDSVALMSVEAAARVGPVDPEREAELLIQLQNGQGTIESFRRAADAVLVADPQIEFAPLMPVSQAIFELVARGAFEASWPIRVMEPDVKSGPFAPVAVLADNGHRCANIFEISSRRFPKFGPRIEREAMSELLLALCREEPCFVAFGIDCRLIAAIESQLSQRLARLYVSFQGNIDNDLNSIDEIKVLRSFDNLKKFVQQKGFVRF
jgi:hypothetical protein